MLFSSVENSIEMGYAVDRYADNPAFRPKANSESLIKRAFVFEEAAVPSHHTNMNDGTQMAGFVQCL